ncbi:hypothetical protein QGW_1483 [Clostridioides difficile 824]|uniref:hypothetical protein n=1 Tax=Clostridioides difficile TaxID=1496 RepID=UPI00038D2CAE|nr:hypothetical protein [Clostridioides difficile]EQF92137.1 hypothetical protein QGW_1483 [Clostridioides difficile 824]EZR28879.1 hypothetical protein BG47_04890 [Clostridioides difficile]MCI4263355.1 hypothetical protein [Clostridioides difficile]MCK1950683.1 hypothetical protein [Clostridioides difficile]MCQ4379258.1 hypothetical protein [Clostridioides difficile]
MSKFKKKPVEVEAFRLGYDIEPEWFFENSRVCNFIQEKCIDGNVSCDLKTLEGTMRANKGDYIIQGVKGEIYPCKADIFEMTYEKVEYTATIENTTNYAGNLEQRHRCVDKEKDEESKLELSAKLWLDTKDFEENIKSATKEIEIFNKAAGKLEQKINGIFGREKVKEVKINIPTISKSESVEEVNGKLLKELKSQKLIVSEKDKKFKKYDICFKNGECISGVIKEHVANKLTVYFSNSQSDIDYLRAIEDEEKLVIFNTADVQTITISDYIENEEIDYI